MAGDGVERAKALEDLQHALIVKNVKLQRDAMRRLGHSRWEFHYCFRWWHVLVFLLVNVAIGVGNGMGHEFYRWLVG